MLCCVVSCDKQEVQVGRRVHLCVFWRQVVCYATGKIFCKECCKYPYPLIELEKDPSKPKEGVQGLVMCCYSGKEARESGSARSISLFPLPLMFSEPQLQALVPLFLSSLFLHWSACAMRFRVHRNDNERFQTCDVRVSHVVVHHAYTQQLAHPAGISEE